MLLLAHLQRSGEREKWNDQHRRIVRELLADTNVASHVRSGPRAASETRTARALKLLYAAERTAQRAEGKSARCADAERGPHCGTRISCAHVLVTRAATVVVVSTKLKVAVIGRARHPPPHVPPPPILNGERTHTQTHPFRRDIHSG